jgi:hypothetical protein
MPASIRTPNPLASTQAAMPELPLARTLNRNPISGLSKTGEAKRCKS